MTACASSLRVVNIIIVLDEEALSVEAFEFSVIYGT